MIAKFTSLGDEIKTNTQIKTETRVKQTSAGCQRKRPHCTKDTKRLRVFSDANLMPTWHERKIRGDFWRKETNSPEKKSDY